MCHVSRLYIHSGPPSHMLLATEGRKGVSRRAERAASWGCLPDPSAGLFPLDASHGLDRAQGSVEPGLPRGLHLIQGLTQVMFEILKDNKYMQTHW